MSALFPFRALRPDPSAVAAVASVPYDVVSTEEARALAAGNPLSFLHVTRSEIDLPAGTNPVRRRRSTRRRSATSRSSSAPRRWCSTTSRRCTSIVCAWAVTSRSASGRVLLGRRVRQRARSRSTRRRARTRKTTARGTSRAARADRAGVPDLSRERRPIDAIVDRGRHGSAPLYDFVAPDGVAAHGVARDGRGRATDSCAAFAALDGAVHRRRPPPRRERGARAPSRVSAAGRRRRRSFRRRGVSRHAGADPAVQPRRQGSRAARRRSPSSVRSRRWPSSTPGTPTPRRKGVVVDVSRRPLVHRRRCPSPAPAAAPDETLDVEVLQRHILEPLLGVGDPRTDKRIDFVGGIRGTGRARAAGRRPARPPSRSRCSRSASTT